MSFSYALSPRLKPNQSATKMFAVSDTAAYLTVFRCSKIAAYLTVFCCSKFNSNAASKIVVNLTAFAVAKLLLRVT